MSSDFDMAEPLRHCACEKASELSIYAMLREARMAGLVKLLRGF
jgi:hypothetical protein